MGALSFGINPVASPYPDIIDNTLGGEFANSYCDLTYAASYFANHTQAAKTTAWAALSDVQQTQALISACWTLEQLKFTVITDYTTPRISDLQYNSRSGRFTAYVSPTQESAKYNFYQMLQFPRNKDVYVDGTLYIPDRILKAQCEQAVYDITFDDSAISSALQGIVLDKVSVGKGAVELTQEYSKVSGTTLAPLAFQYVKPYLIYSLRLKRS